MKKAFTLIELLFVVVVIGVLASIILYGLGSSKSKERDVQRKDDLQQIKASLELYYADQKPSSYKIQTTPVPINAVNTGLTQNYIKNIPVDPRGNNPYLYVTNAAGTGFAVFAALENTSDPDIKSDAEPAVGNKPVSSAYNYFVENTN